MNKLEITQRQRWEIAERLARERLPIVNKLCEEVKFHETIYTKYIKRFIDILLSLIAIIITLPINLIIAVITYIDVGFPIIFKQTRVGKNKKNFNIIKFRNMRNECDENGELLPASERVTKFGKFVRRFSLDELLNFLLVLKGDMSLIGPRPLTPDYLSRYNNRHKMRLAVKPGLECPPRKISTQIWGWQERFENDVWYVENVSFRVDCMMAIRLIQYALNRKNANIRASANIGIFIGYDLNGTAITLEQVPKEYLEQVNN